MLIIVASIVALLSLASMDRIFHIESPKFRLVAMVAAFVITMPLAYGGWRALAGAGWASVAFHEKQARQLEHPLLTR
ncbi:hypothetical protein [Sphingomonas carotinifaciens]|uniref:hypothetical protein n=1 Tax=Sphingomonas carotinifaciens TaxID=1166323 RepID=UPI001967350C|nr:hypothetical protein [Sphingomonas carotinifaciens]